MKHYEVIERKLKIYSRCAIAIVVISVVVQMELDIVNGIWNFQVFWGTNISLCVALFLGYFAFEKYLKEFDSVTCDRCRWCDGKRDGSNVTLYYCRESMGKRYVDPGARRACDYFEGLDPEERRERDRRILDRRISKLTGRDWPEGPTSADE